MAAFARSIREPQTTKDAPTRATSRRASTHVLAGGQPRASHVETLHEMRNTSPRVQALAQLERSVNAGSGVAQLAHLSALLQKRSGAPLMRTADREKSRSVRAQQRERARRDNLHVSARDVIQRSVGRAGTNTEFLYPESTFDNKAPLKVNQEFEILEPYEMSGPYIKIKVGTETGWALAAHVVPTVVEADVARYKLYWDGLLAGAENEPLTPELLQHAITVRTEIDDTRRSINSNWPGFYLADVHRGLHRYRSAKLDALRLRFPATINHLFARVSTTRDVDTDRKWIALLRDEIENQNYKPYLEAVLWQLLLEVLEGGNFREVYAAFIKKTELKGNPQEDTPEGPVTHAPPMIGPKTAYTSGETTKPARTSRVSPDGAEIERADTRAGLKLARTDAKVYTTHQRDMDNPSIYINGRPTSNDVAQTGIGDCYYLAVVSSIADRDPGRIKHVLPDPGSSATVQATLYYLSGTHFLEQRITLDQSLAYADGTSLKGARFRIKPSGKSLWILKQGKRDNQWIEEIRYYRTALWAPLLEKAYARFAEKHGQYGFALGSSKVGGYATITVGGNPENVFRVFYGPQVQAKSIEMSSEQKVSQIEATLPDEYVKAVQALIQFANRGTQSATQDRRMLMTASASPRTLFQRVVTYAETMKRDDFSQLRGKGDLEQLVETQLMLLSDKLQVLIKQSEGLKDDDPSIVPILSTAQNYSSYLLEYLNEGLGEAKPNARLRHLMQLVFDVVGGEARLGGSKRRFVYARHAYTVSDVNFVDKRGKRMRLDSSSQEAGVKAAMGEMDWMKSTVTLVNPHHANSPDFYGQRTDDSGKFTIWLTQFFRNFTTLHAGIVPRR